MTSLKHRLAGSLLVVAGAFVASEARAFQFGGMMSPPQAEPAPSREAQQSATARMELARQAIATIDEMKKKGQAPKNGDDTHLWERRLAEAAINLGKPRDPAVEGYLSTLKEAESRAKPLDNKGEMTALSYFEAKFRRLEFEGLIHSEGVMMGGIGGGSPGGFDGGFDGGVGGNDRPKKPRTQHPADLERNKAIEQKLETAVSINFAQETPLEDVIKYLKQTLADPKGKPVPIYVDPAGLQDAEKTMNSPVALDIQDVPLRTTLRLILNQIALDYRVRDGMIYVTSRESFDQEDEDAKAFAAPAAAPATPTGGGFR